MKQHFYKKNIKNTPQGFSLIELILILSIASMVSLYTFQASALKQRIITAEATGQQMVLVSNAVNNYITLRYNNIAFNTPLSASDIGPRTCYLHPSGEQLCDITIQTLVNDRLLPQGFVNSTTNPFHSTYHIQLKRKGVIPNYSIDGLVMTSNPWIGNFSGIQYDLLSFASLRAGRDSGITISTSPPTALTLSGLGGAWTTPSTDWNGMITSIGQLGILTGTSSYAYSPFLPRNGALPMTGDLMLMDNNGKNYDIQKIKNLNVSGDTSLPSTIGVLTSGNILSSTTGVITAPVLSVLAIRPIDSTKTIDLTGTRIKIDDIFLKAHKQWVSNTAPVYSDKGVYIRHNGEYVTKPDCSATANIPVGTTFADIPASLQKNGTPKIIISSQINLSGFLGHTAGFLPSSAAVFPLKPTTIGGHPNPAVPDIGKAYGASVVNATNDPTNPTRWIVHALTPDSHDPTISNVSASLLNQVIVQVFCEFQ